jgi:UDP-N-acetylmuramate-alanine ligase
MVVGGKVALRLSPDALADLAGTRVSALISATNGKTSTTRLLATAASQAGPVARSRVVEVSWPTSAAINWIA